MSDSISRQAANETVIRLSDYERTCRNCVYLDEDSCSCPNGWYLDDKNRCSQFKRKQKRKGEKNENQSY